MDWLKMHDEYDIYDEDSLNERLKKFVLLQFKNGCDNEQEMLDSLCDKFFYIDKDEIIKRLDESI